MKEELTDALNMLIDYRLDSVHTCLPGKILAFNETTRIAKVEPLVKLKTNVGVDVSIPAIENVPVVFPSGSAFSLRWDIVSGDGCMILFSESGIGNFLNATENVQIESDDLSRFSLTDAICVPGLFSVHKARELSKDNEIYIDINGKTFIKSKEIESSATGAHNINGSSINLNGSSKSFVTHTELNTAIQTFILALNALFGTKLDGGGTPGTLTLDISASQTTTVKTGG